MDYHHRRDRSHSPTDPRRHPHPSTHSQPSRSRDSSLDFRRKGYAERNDPRRSSSNPPEQGAEGSSGGKKRGKMGKGGQWDVPGSFKSHSSPSKSIRPLSTNGPLGLGRGGPSWPTHKGKKTKKASASYAEAAKKKALATAASKLRQTFLASKKKSSGGENSLLEESEGNEGPGRSPCDDNNAQDLTMPRRHPSCLEFDIDIRFSAKEWASVGRGQGGAAGVLADPQGSSVPGKHLHKGNNLGEEQEDSGTYSDTDVGRNDSHWSPLPGPDQASSSSTRRRHLSESSGVIDLRKNPPSRGSAARPVSTRTRSCSLSLVEGGPGTSRGAQQGGSHPSRIKLHLMPKLRHLMLKQLLCMDKKSLQELVDDPRSRKAQFMMSHLMSEHRAALSQRLAQQRFKTPDALADDELQLLNSMEGAQLSSLPPEVVQQVREILALEQEGGEGVWEAATISLSDLLLGCDSDPECQIVSPPPRDPTSTITIHDTDSEMEELPEEEEHEYEEDEEDEEVESDHELTEGHVSLVANDDSEMEEIEEDGLDDGVEDDSEEEDREKTAAAAAPSRGSSSPTSTCKHQQQQQLWQQYYQQQQHPHQEHR
ncbi:hypothetical protein GWK47_014676 [Chionoecetes opilio]|uniref:Uncharacterized protein n=1 Tax=Chionoecetes opilio TaxID=41210 RepID=A0A8J5CNA6_CHIOP|nr:hypothetical protein GWK47_014676 [Chionoecetes opilio]